jgi:SNF2 family DNA or RNA helicase
MAETSYASDVSAPTIFLINFDGVRNIASILQEIGFDMVIVDESTKIKSPRALRTKVLWSITRHARRRIIMTGFPITEHLGEIYSQIKFLDMGETFGNSYYAFLDKYFYKAGFKRILRRNSAKKIFKLISPFTVRVNNDVLNLPPKVYQQKLLEPTKQQRELFESLKEYFQLELGKVKIDTEYIFALINKSLQICDGFVQDDKGNLEVIETEKDQALIDLVDDIDPYKNKILIWAIFRFSIKKIRRIFKKIYGNDDVKTWMKNKRMTEGKFE